MRFASEPSKVLKQENNQKSKGTNSTERLRRQNPPVPGRIYFPRASVHATHLRHKFLWSGTAIVASPYGCGLHHSSPRGIDDYAIPGFRDPSCPRGCNHEPLTFLLKSERRRERERETCIDRGGAQNAPSTRCNAGLPQIVEEKSWLNYRVKENHPVRILRRLPRA